jgi:hypothetical protein
VNGSLWVRYGLRQIRSLSERKTEMLNLQSSLLSVGEPGRSTESDLYVLNLRLVLPSDQGKRSCSRSSPTAATFRRG